MTISSIISYMYSLLLILSFRYLLYNNDKTVTVVIDTDVVARIVGCVKTFDKIVKCVRHHAVTLGHFHAKQYLKLWRISTMTATYAMKPRSSASSTALRTACPSRNTYMLSCTRSATIVTVVAVQMAWL